MKILHVSDDNIFVNSAFHVFEKSFPGGNHFLIFSHNNAVKSVSQDIPVTLLDSKLRPERYQGIEDFNYIVLHSLSYQNAYWLLNQTMPKSQRIIWMLHGYEFNDGALVKNKEKFSVKTMHFLSFSFKIRSAIKLLLRPFVETFVTTQNKTVVRAARTIDYFGVLYEEEYAKLKLKYAFKAEMLFFTYYPLSRIVPEEIGFVSGNNILLGNSASLHNNHLDIIEQLKEIDLRESKVITPLSYGDRNYMKYVSKQGHEKLPRNFYPLDTFMPIEDYNKLLNSCGVTIMNHYIQQAVGTILAMLYLGSKVYLNPKNSVYHFLLRIGVVVFNVETDLKNANSLMPLEIQQKESNREIISSLLDDETLSEILKKSLVN